MHQETCNDLFSDEMRVMGASPNIHIVSVHGTVLYSTRIKHKQGEGDPLSPYSYSTMTTSRILIQRLRRES